MTHRLLLNQIGIEAGPLRQRILVSAPDLQRPAFQLRSADDGELRSQGALLPLPPAWRAERLAYVPLGDLLPGRYTLNLESQLSVDLEVSDTLLLDKTLGPVLEYFTKQRCAPPWDDADRNLGFTGSRSDRVDVHGGWYDASGDVSKYLSHLSYANFMNPQQTPLVVWGLLEHFERRQLSATDPVGARLLDEARYGADFLCRMQDPAGYFYMTVFDRWSKKLEEREICAYMTQQGIKLESYQSGYRQGAGVTIAALARAARLDTGLEAERRDRYIRCAETGFAHLERHNLEYLDDGKENIIDDYCALLAACELYALLAQPEYLKAARYRAGRLCDRLVSTGSLPGWFRADDGQRPFYHAAEAGLPVVALLRWSEIEPDAAERARLFDTAEASLRFELAVTREVDNPYGYARQYVQNARGERYTSFFIPHDNETGYWWQGENARLASLAAAAGLFDRLSTTASAELRKELIGYAWDQLDWILGKNPYDACMLHGFGRNNVEYMTAWPNCPGGICNGITSGYDDESDIDFARTEGLDGDHSWRWQEQWLPHAAWYVIALAELER